MFVENRMHQANLIAIDILVIPRVEMVVRSFTSSSRNGHKVTVQNLDRIEIKGTTKTLRSGRLLTV